MRRTSSTLPIVPAILACAFALAHSTASANWQQPCIDAWADAPASSYCTSTSVTRVSGGPSYTHGKCLIAVTSCSIEVLVGSQNETFTPDWPDALSPSRNGVSVADTSRIDICFTDDSDGWSAEVKTGCSSTETDSEAAVDDGLSDGATGS